LRKKKNIYKFYYPKYFKVYGGAERTVKKIPYKEINDKENII